MMIDGLVLLAAPTARSRAYIQALVAAGLLPERVVLLGEESDPPGPALHAVRQWQGLVLPDHGESIAATCGGAGIPVQACAAGSVNEEEAGGILRALAPRVLIYSGAGGQIVSASVLGLGFPFLHVHSGYLPDYRGSTTLYYALLNGDAPGVTAIVLDRTIDTGPVIARRTYPRPPQGMDIDQVFDPAIRADLLVHVVADFSRRGALEPIEMQDPAVGVSYYVIHPVLKHLGILSLASASEQ